jgi:hypothetical protein
MAILRKSLRKVIASSLKKSEFHHQGTKGTMPTFHKPYNEVGIVPITNNSYGESAQERFIFKTLQNKCRLSFWEARVYPKGYVKDRLHQEFKKPAGAGRHYPYSY